MNAAKEFICSKLFFNMTKSNLSFFISMVFLMIPEFQGLFKSSPGLLGLYLYIALIAAAAQAGSTVGRLTDALVLVLASLFAGGILGSLIPLISSESVIGPRFLGFSIFGCLLVSFGIISTINGGLNPKYSPQPLLYYSIVAFLIGCLISGSICFLVFPIFAHSELREYLSSWTNDLFTYIALIFNEYSVENESEQDVSKREALAGSLLARISLVEYQMGDVESEVNYSHLPFPALADLVHKLKSLTRNVLFMNRSVRTYRQKSNEKLPNHETIQTLGLNLSNLLQEKLESIKSRIENDKTLRNDFSDSSLEKPKMKAQNQIIGQVVGFEIELRKSIFFHFKSNDENQNQTGKVESILPIYHIALALEQVARGVIDIDEYLFNKGAKREWYFPFKKWIPSRYCKFVLSAFDLKRYQRNGKFSFPVLFASIASFLKANVWTIKSAFAMTAFLIIFFDPTGRKFWNQYGLAGGLITLIIILSPTMGGSYLASIYQLIGSVAGNTAGMVTFYIIGPNPWILWIPCILVGYPSYYILIKYPKLTSIGLLMLLGFSGTFIACWNQQFTSNPQEYWYIWARGVVSLLIGLSFGVSFNLFVFPTFAKNELNNVIAEVLDQLEKVYISILDVPFLYFTDMENGVDKNEALTHAEARTNKIGTSLSILSAKFLQMRALLDQAKIEPEIELAFDPLKYENVINQMQRILYTFVGAKLTLAEPWYAQGELWKEYIDKKEQRYSIIQTMQVLFRLYESSVLLKRKPLEKRPSAAHSREKQKYNMLVSHFERSLTELEDSLPDTEEEGLADCQWRSAKKIAESGTECGLNSKNLYYYSYVSFMREVLKETDDLGNYIDELY